MDIQQCTAIIFIARLHKGIFQKTINYPHDDDDIPKGFLKNYGILKFFIGDKPTCRAALDLL